MVIAIFNFRVAINFENAVRRTLRAREQYYSSTVFINRIPYAEFVADEGPGAGRLVAHTVITQKRALRRRQVDVNNDFARKANFTKWVDAVGSERLEFCKFVRKTIPRQTSTISLKKARERSIRYDWIECSGKQKRQHKTTRIRDILHSFRGIFKNIHRVCSNTFCRDISNKSLRKTTAEPAPKEAEKCYKRKSLHKIKGIKNVRFRPINWGIFSLGMACT